MVGELWDWGEGAGFMMENYIPCTPLCQQEPVEKELERWRILQIVHRATQETKTTTKNPGRIMH